MYCRCCCRNRPGWRKAQRSMGVIGKSLHKLGCNIFRELHFISRTFRCFCLLPFPHNVIKLGVKGFFLCIVECYQMPRQIASLINIIIILLEKHCRYCCDFTCFSLENFCLSSKEQSIYSARDHYHYQHDGNGREWRKYLVGPPSAHAYFQLPQRPHRR